MTASARSSVGDGFGKWRMKRFYNAHSSTGTGLDASLPWLRVHHVRKSQIQLSKWTNCCRSQRRLRSVSTSVHSTRWATFSCSNRLLRSEPSARGAIGATGIVGENKKEKRTVYQSIARNAPLSISRTAAPCRARKVCILAQVYSQTHSQCYLRLQRHLPLPAHVRAHGPAFTSICTIINACR